MKFCSSVILSLFIIVLLSPLNVFACACCAERGHYSISYSKMEQYNFDEIKKLNFHNAKIYMTVAGEEGGKGLSSIGESYQLKSSLQNKMWTFNFTDDKGKTGTLNFKMPNKMLDFKADIHDGKDTGAGGPLLYKEWRFKHKVKSGTGVFQNGIKGKTEYFLVLQGRGNVCTSAADFTHWRLEVTGKKANYAFYGSFNSKNTAKEKSIVKDIKVKAINPDTLSVSNLVGKNYVGCGCSGITLKEAKKKGKKKLFFWSESKQNSDNKTLFMNINGKDTELKLRKKGNRPEKEKIGTHFTDEYEADGTKVVLDYRTKKLPCDGCEGTDYDVTATIIGKYNGKVLTLLGSCGC